jgi:hypothetical protein
MQGSTGGSLVPFNAIPYGGDHVPPLSPLLNGDFQQPIGSDANYILFGERILGHSSYTTSVGSMLFSLFDTFGNNAFSLAAILVGGSLSFGKQNPVQGTIPTQGASTRVFSSQGLWNPWQGSFPLQGMSVRGNPSMVNGTPGRVQYLCLSDGLGVSPSKILGTQHREKSLPKPCRPIMGVS